MVMVDTAVRVIICNAAEVSVCHHRNDTLLCCTPIKTPKFETCPDSDRVACLQHHALGRRCQPENGEQHGTHALLTLLNETRYQDAQGKSYCGLVRVGVK